MASRVFDSIMFKELYMLLKIKSKPPIKKQVFILSLKYLSLLIKNPIKDENNRLKTDIKKADGSKNNPVQNKICPAFSAKNFFLLSEVITLDLYFNIKLKFF